MISDFILEKNVDLFCMTETWLSGEPKDNATLAAITPPGYSVKHVPRTEGRGGEVGIIHRDACSLKLIKTSVFKSFEHMTVRVVSGSSQYHIFIIYRPPPSAVNKLTFTGFMDEFTEFLAEAVMTTGKLLILGDFNIHVNSASSESNKFQSLLDMYNLSQNVTSPTHNHGHTLDLVITRTDDETINETAVTDPLISDHSAITLTLNTSRPPRPKKTVTFRSFKKLDRDAFNPHQHNAGQF